jgi:hypothetical protein
VVLIVWGLDLQVPVQSVPISTEAVSSYPANDEVYLMQHYAIKFMALSVSFNNISIIMWRSDLLLGET